MSIELWTCPSCGHRFDRDYGDGVCPHCQDPLRREFACFPVPERPYGWIQWKGTDVCLDVHCACGAHLHFDGDFAYYLQCGQCLAVYMNHGYITLTELFGEAREAALGQGSALKVLEKDDDDDDDDE